VTKAHPGSPAGRGNPTPPKETTRGPRLTRAGALFIALAVLAAACAPPAERPRPLNVLLVTLDTLRNDHCSLSGYARETTPALDELARGGTRFALAYAPTATTGPSHATLFTSRFPITHGVVKNGMALGPDFLTLAETLQGAGYRTAAVVSSFVLDAKFGFDQGFESYDDSFDPRFVTIKRTEFDGHSVDGAFDQRGNETTRKATAELARLAEAGAPFFLFVHYFDPHAPWVPPPEWPARLGPAPPGPPADPALIDAYDGEIAFTDSELGKLLAAIVASGLAADTLVVVTADHGEGLMQHGHMNHGVNIYEEAVRVPLVFHLPGRIEAGHVVHEPVELLDVAPTILALAGVTPREAPDGRSLAGPLTEGGRLDAEHPVFLHRRYYDPTTMDGRPVAGEKFGVRVGPWKYIEGPDEGTRELYNLADDPGETTNVAGRHPDLAEKAATYMKAAHRPSWEPKWNF
jgi:arylsulfatase A-like enzyme